MDILNLNSHLILEPPHINDPSYETVELLTTTAVTVNGSKQRVSAVTYDDLGASPQSNVAQNSGGTVSYTYNLHGQTKSITGPGFTQNLYYADWTGMKLYNGSVKPGPQAPTRV